MYIYIYTCNISLHCIYIEINLPALKLGIVHIVLVRNPMNEFLKLGHGTHGTPSALESRQPRHGGTLKVQALGPSLGEFCALGRAIPTTSQQ